MKKHPLQLEIIETIEGLLDQIPADLSRSLASTFFLKFLFMTVGDDDPGKMDVLIDEFVQDLKRSSRFGLAIDGPDVEVLLLGNVR